MAMLAPKASWSGSLGGSTQHPSRHYSESSQRTQMASPLPAHEQLFTSPTESEFSVVDGLDSVR